MWKNVNFLCENPENYQHYVATYSRLQMKIIQCWQRMRGVLNLHNFQCINSNQPIHSYYNFSLLLEYPHRSELESDNRENIWTARPLPTQSYKTWIPQSLTFRVGKRRGEETEDQIPSIILLITMLRLLLLLLILHTLAPRCLLAAYVILPR